MMSGWWVTLLRRTSDSDITKRKDKGLFVMIDVYDSVTAVRDRIHNVKEAATPVKYEGESHE